MERRTAPVVLKHSILCLKYIYTHTTAIFVHQVFPELSYGSLMEVHGSGLCLQLQHTTTGFLFLVDVMKSRAPNVRQDLDPVSTHHQQRLKPSHQPV